MQVTFLSCWHPYPADNGAKVRALALLRALAVEHILDLVVLDDADTPPADAGPLASLCRSITTVRIPRYQPQTLRARLAYFDRLPRSLTSTYAPAVTALLEQRIAAGECDAVVCAGANPRTAIYGLKVADHVPVIIDELEPSRYVDAVRRASTPIRRARVWLMWRKYRAFCRALLRACAGCFVVSEHEAALLRSVSKPPYRVGVVPNGVTLASVSPAMKRDRDRLVYNGSPAYAFNLEAITYFVHHILPRVRERMSLAYLAVTGNCDGASLGDLTAQSGVTFTEWIADIRTYVAESRVCVVPLQRGGGTRLKILEAMALGTPVVSTTKGAEGLAVTNGEDILIADDPADFAAATLRLLTDDALHARIAARARSTVVQYDWETIGTTLRAQFADLLKPYVPLVERDVHVCYRRTAHDATAQAMDAIS